MNLWELTDPDAKIVTFVKEGVKNDPVKTLVEASLRFEKDVGEIVQIVKNATKKAG